MNNLFKPSSSAGIGSITGLIVAFIMIMVIAAILYRARKKSKSKSKKSAEIARAVQNAIHNTSQPTKSKAAAAPLSFGAFTTKAQPNTSNASILQSIQPNVPITDNPLIHSSPHFPTKPILPIQKIRAPIKSISPAAAASLTTYRTTHLNNLRNSVQRSTSASIAHRFATEQRQKVSFIPSTVNANRNRSKTPASPYTVQVEQHPLAIKIDDLVKK